MPLFNILGKCCEDVNIKEENKMKTDIEDIKKDIQVLYRRSDNIETDLKRIEDKIDVKFEMLNNKIDNLIMIINSR